MTDGPLPSYGTVFAGKETPEVAWGKVRRRMRMHGAKLNTREEELHKAFLDLCSILTEDPDA